jgi:hypothetical protein
MLSTSPNLCNDSKPDSLPLSINISDCISGESTTLINNYCLVIADATSSLLVKPDELAMYNVVPSG